VRAYDNKPSLRKTPKVAGKVDITGDGSLPGKSHEKLTGVEARGSSGFPSRGSASSQPPVRFGFLEDCREQSPQANMRATWRSTRSCSHNPIKEPSRAISGVTARGALSSRVLFKSRPWRFSSSNASASACCAQKNKTISTARAASVGGQDPFVNLTNPPKPKRVPSHQWEDQTEPHMDQVRK
jgi:hypothetical protein